MDLALLAGTGVLLAIAFSWWSWRAYRAHVRRADEARERDEGESRWEALGVVLLILVTIAVIARVVWG